jgi:hypothetical protein
MAGDIGEGVPSTGERDTTSSLQSSVSFITLGLKRLYQGKESISFWLDFSGEAFIGLIADLFSSLDQFTNLDFEDLIRTVNESYFAVHLQGNIRC